MNGVNKNKAGLFLMEMIVVTLFFSLMAVVSVRIFVGGSLLSQKSRALTNGIAQVQTAAQLLKSSGGSMKSVQDYYGILENEVYFNEESEICPKEEADFVMKIQQREAEQMVFNEISFEKIADNSCIYSVTTKVYGGMP